MKNEILARLRRLEVKRGAPFTDDEVKAILCQAMNQEYDPEQQAHWEQMVVEIAAKICADKEQ